MDGAEDRPRYPSFIRGCALAIPISLLVAVAIVAVALAVTFLIYAPVPTDVAAVGGVSCGSKAAAAAAQVGSAAQRAARLRSKSSRMLRSQKRSISKLLETARKLPRVEAPVSAHRISAARTRLRRPNEQQRLGHNFVN